MLGSIGNDSELVIHNAKFDIGFLNKELKLSGHRTISSNKVLDTLKLAREKFPGSPVSLDALSKRFGISLEEREIKGHGAFLDLEILYDVYVKLTEVSKGESLTLKENIVKINDGGGGKLGIAISGAILILIATLLYKHKRKK